MIQWLKRKIDNWLEKEEKGMERVVASRYRQSIKKQCPELFDDD